jgi:outer membrane protein OmpA-like peptidoglycan-associated protein
MKDRNLLGKWANSFVIFLALLAVPGWSLPQEAETVPIYKITVVERTTTAINYRHRGGSTTIDFEGTELLPKARGEAKVESKQGYMEIEVEFDDLQSATQFGTEYLTYVLWAITPEGRATNLGEILLNGTKSKLNVTTELQAFGLIVTAEPHFAVTRPSNIVVMETALRPETRGSIEQVQAKYELLERGQYTAEVDKSKLVPIRLDSNVPLELYEAQNAVRIAEWAWADKYAGESFRKAEGLLQQAEDYQARKANRGSVVMMARQAAQTAEDARIIAVKRRLEEQEANERRAAAEREARAQAEAAAEAQRRSQAETERAAAERAKLEAERAKQDAQVAANLAARQQAEAEAARAAALAQQQAAQADAERSRRAAEEANRLRQEAENDKAALRAQLLEQLNRILETRDTARGLIVNLSDVLFDFGKYTLRPEAREKLAKISGIVLSHPGLYLEVEGHTDSVGSEEFNQQLSENRAESVRDYLAQQGVSRNDMIARGLGETMPVALNDTAVGRQQNRRVELVVSGEVISTLIDSSSQGIVR